MPVLELQVLGRRHLVQCDEGQELHLRRLAQDIDQRMQALVEQYGHVGYSRLLLLVALQLRDELFDAEQAIAHGAGPEADAEVARVLERAAERIERLAARVEGA